MAKNSAAHRMLSYLRKEEVYIKDLRKFMETQLFRLQIEELNLSAAYRNQQVKIKKVKLEEETKCEAVAKHPRTSNRVSSLNRNPKQNIQVMPPASPSASTSLEPLCLDLDPDTSMESDEEED